MPARAKTWFGHSFGSLKKQSIDKFSDSMSMALRAANISFEQKFYQLPKSSFLIVTDKGRILLDCQKWSDRPDPSYWLDLEKTRKYSNADFAWSVFPDINGHWSNWLSNSGFDCIQTMSFSQLNHWLHSNKQL